MKNPYLLFALRISILYAIFGALWMTVSTYLLHAHASNEQELMRFYTYGSWTFVGITGLLLYFLLRRDLQAREQAEKALRESEDKYRTVFETTGSATMIIEENAIIAMVNTEFEKLFGYSREELENKKSLIELVAPEDAERIKEHHRKRMIAPASEPRSYEAMLIDKQGKVKNIVMTVAMIPRTKKRVVSVWDITERKQLEDALKQQHDHLDELVKERTAELQQEITERKRAEQELKYRFEFEKLITSISTKFINLAPNEIDSGINNALGEIGQFAGMDRCYVMLFSEKGTKINDIYEWCADDIEPTVEKLQGTSVSGFPWWMERMCRLENIACAKVLDLPTEANTEKEILLAQGVKSIVAVPLIYGKSLLGFLGFHAVRAEKNWPEEVIALLKIVGEIVVNALEHKRAQQTLAESEERYRGMVDLSPEAIAVLSDGEIVFVNDAAVKLIGLNNPADMIGKPLLEYMHPDSRKIANEQAWQALEMGSTAPFIEMQCLRSDGTTRDVEAAVVPLTLSGKAAVQVVVRDITERKQLAQEMARLDRLNLVGEMAASIAHEVRNPMTTVRGFLQLFRGKEQFAESIEYLDLMIKELDMANAIITEYLALARNKPVNLEMQNLNAIIESLFPLIQADAALADKYAQIELGNIPELLLDKKEINQLMLNFVRNGLEAMSAGGGLTIKTFLDGEAVILAVQDQGKGIEPEVLNKMGTPFFTTKDNGTGLGMAVCYSIAARHKATISVQTSPKGTTFFVQFMCAKRLSPKS